MFKKIIGIFVVIFFAVALVFTYEIIETGREYDGWCKDLENIARDGQKIDYLNSWIDEKIKDKDLLELAGKMGEIRIYYQPYLISKIGIDWSYLGLNPGLGFVRFNRLYKDWDSYTDGDKLKSVTVGQGRFGIIIKVNDSKELGLEWPHDALEKIKHVNDEVSFYCGM